MKPFIIPVFIMDEWDELNDIVTVSEGPTENNTPSDYTTPPDEF